ncbi:MAG: leucine-rich repeat domain-containing protein [Bacteroidaceae bacterium]|nr:leucine-rich repeat domain-containing protein [Bacteroidaceae bacterium]
MTTIGDKAFANTGLTSITVDAGNTIYDSRDNCNAIIETASNKLLTGCKNTIIPNSVTSIAEEAFYSCSSLASVTIPNSVTKIDNKAFENCYSLNSVTIGNGVTRIGKRAFDGADITTIISLIENPFSIYGRTSKDKTFTFVSFRT